MRTKAEKKTRKYWTWFFLASIAGGMLAMVSPIIWPQLVWQWRALIGIGVFGLMFIPIFVREPRRVNNDA